MKNRLLSSCSLLVGSVALLGSTLAFANPPASPYLLKISCPAPSSIHIIHDANGQYYDASAQGTTSLCATPNGNTFTCNGNWSSLGQNKTFNGKQHNDTQPTALTDVSVKKSPTTGNILVSCTYDTRLNIVTVPDLTSPSDPAPYQAANNNSIVFKLFA